MTMPKSPYGGGPGAGLTIPPYFKPTSSVKSRINYFPNSEKLGPDEMRISFMGSTPFPPRIDQAGTCIMVELGNGDSFFFDFGPGCLHNILAIVDADQVFAYPEYPGLMELNRHCGVDATVRPVFG